MLARLERDPVSVYVHLPFCGYRCHYCACTVTVATRIKVIDRYLDQVERELDLVTAIAGHGRRVLQLHLGCGTPNVLTVGQFARLGDMLERRFAFAHAAERSVEADPRRVTGEQLAALRAWLPAHQLRGTRFRPGGPGGHRAAAARGGGAGGGGARPESGVRWDQH
jgi:oxygen-independent coproporphyrinogen-3 oxidase